MNEDDAIASLDETEGGDVMVKIDGRSFRCKCGCNVFRHPKNKPNWYRCNSCASTYEAE